jgi:AraC family transcriptional regulator
MIRVQHLDSGSSLTLAQRTPGEDDPALTIVIGGGRGCVLRIGSPVLGAWVPLRGRLQLLGGSAACMLLPGEARITEPESGISAIGRGACAWIALLGPRQAWRRAFAQSPLAIAAEPLLLPAWHAVDFAFRRRAIALARAAAHGAAPAELHALAESLCELQDEHSAAIDRCPGRTHEQRRHVFLRLQRVRTFLAANSHLEIDNERLARMASYSRWHFIRAFREVYEQTPHAFLVDQRLQRARRLLRSSRLGVGEIAIASGFGNRCAFSRLFRQRFGITATALRRCG